MLLTLTCHPDTPCDAVERIEVSVHRGEASRLTLTFHIIGDMSRLALPAYVGARRADELWKHTCLELFVRGDKENYLEFNFSPSGQWAAYAFDGYRSGMVPAPDELVTANGSRIETGSLGLISSVDLSSAPGLRLDAPLTLGLSAVIEETSGLKSYWALAHAPGKPDFHHPSAFASEVPTVVYW